MSGQQLLIDDVAHRRDELDRSQHALTQPGEVRDELQARLLRVAKAMNDPDWLDTRRQLVTLAATCLRAARDLGLDTEDDAVRKDGDHS